MISQRTLQHKSREIENLYFFERLDLVNRVIQGASDQEQMLSNLLDTIVNIYDCDRAYLLYPCDPKTLSLQIPMERNRPGFPYISNPLPIVPMDKVTQNALRVVLNSAEPATYYINNLNEIMSEEFIERNRVKSFMAMAIYPKINKPWLICIHQCSRERDWSPFDKRLFLEISRRLADGLSSTLAYQNLMEAEQKLRQLNIELEQRVKERTVELEDAYRELKQAHSSVLQQEKMASLGQLASGIAHEINTPTQYVGNNITFLSSSLEDLLNGIEQHRKDLSEKCKDRTETLDSLDALFKEIDFDYLKTESIFALKESEEGIKRISDIVRAMKDFAHPGAFQLEPVDLENLIKSTVEICRNEWKVVAQLSIEHESLPLNINGLRSELGQVMLNLIINAVDAIADTLQGENKQGHIWIRTRKIDHWAEIQITDTGCGIPQSLQLKIFEPFFTTKKAGHGSGQGLAIVYNIIADKHQGELSVNSEPGKGSTFTVRLPLAESQED
jgi:signal transduction histidine kinase